MKQKETDDQSMEKEIDEEEEKFIQKWKELNENLELGKAGVVDNNGQWHIEVGTALSPAEALGPPNDEVIEANKRKPLRQLLAELYP